MKRLNLKAFICIIFLATTFNSRAEVTSILWSVDSYSGFDLTINGTGKGFGYYRSNAITSPTGLWQFFGGAGAVTNQYGLFVSARGDMEFLQPYPTSSPYRNFTNTTSLHATGYMDPVGSRYVSIVDGHMRDQQNFSEGELNDMPYGYIGWEWTGSTSIEFTSMPDMNDLSTWSWTAHYYASGPDLGDPMVVPEPATWIFSSIGSLLFLGARKALRRRSC